MCAHACVGVCVSMRMRVRARSARARAFVRGGGQFPPVYQCFLFLFLEEGEEEQFRASCSHVARFIGVFYLRELPAVR